MQPLVLWTVYERPADHPDGFVGRKWLVTTTHHPTSEVVVGATLEQVREAIAIKSPGLVRLARQPDDDPCIVEVWL